MRLCLPDEKYQHFYEGLPSTNGLSGKWISEIAIFTGEPPLTPGELPDNQPNGDSLPLIPIALGVAGVTVIVGSAIIIFRRKKT
jgi:hypothetical protein